MAEQDLEFRLLIHGVVGGGSALGAQLGHESQDQVQGISSWGGESGTSQKEGAGHL